MGRNHTVQLTDQELRLVHLELQRRGAELSRQARNSPIPSEQVSLMQRADLFFDLADRFGHQRAAA